MKVFLLLISLLALSQAITYGQTRVSNEGDKFPEDMDRIANYHSPKNITKLRYINDAQYSTKNFITDRTFKDIKKITCFTEITLLELNFRYNKISDLTPLVDVLTSGSFRKLNYIILNFEHNKLTNLDFAKKSFRGYPQLTNLLMEFGGNEITNLDGLKKSLKNNNELNYYSIDVSYNKISNIDGLQNLFQNNEILKYAFITLTHNYIEDISPIVTTFEGLAYFTRIYLYFDKNFITDVSPLQHGLGFATQKNSFYDFNLNLDGNPLQSSLPLNYFQMAQQEKGKFSCSIETTRCNVGMATKNQFILFEDSKYQDCKVVDNKIDQLY